MYSVGLWSRSFVGRLLLRSSEAPPAPILNSEIRHKPRLLGDVKSPIEKSWFRLRHTDIRYRYRHGHGTRIWKGFVLPASFWIVSAERDPIWPSRKKRTAGKLL